MTDIKFVSLIVASMVCCILDKLIASHTPTNCRISEFYCKTERCIPSNKVCNGVDDCGDKSDEPPYCSPCNKTYYGDVGHTYELEVRRPREDRLPFLCFLNFTAAGDSYGDIIQITFDAFTVGKFVSYIVDGCPDGYMTIFERDLPNIGGQWCGSAWGYTVYYSETPSINLTLFLSKLSEQGIGYNFDFKISYKYVRKTDARLRYGNSTVSSYRGNLVASTYCDHILEQCDIRTCRIQSPNYPGIYPRNVTCYYRVEVRDSIRGKQPLVAVSQRYAHKVHIKDQFNKYDRAQRTLRVWDQCNVIQDYLTVYDGATTEDPTLVRLCGGGAVPDIISSGAHMLLEFHTSPYDNPFHPVPLSYLPGFELDVKILYVDVGSMSYVPNKHKCEFVITSLKGIKNWGYLENPKHSLPPNTTCRYHFQGRKHQNVWLSFVKYHAASWDPNAYHLEMECNAKLTILDGPIRAPNGQQVNATIIGEFCKDEIPRLCDHAILRNHTRVTRPCTLAESYVSSGSDLTLDIFLLRGSVLFPLNFQLRYEFVDTSLEGVRLPESRNLCDRIFTSADSLPAFGKFYSPRSVFYYGRGGSMNLSCVFKFKPNTREKVQLRFTSASFGDRSCNTLNDTSTDRLRCVYENGNVPKSQAEIWISEYVWPGVHIPRSCICSELKQPFKIISLVSSVLEVNFTVTNMNVTEDFENIFFDGEYHFVNEISLSDSEICLKNLYNHQVRGSSGEITNREHKHLGNSFTNEHTVQIGDAAKYAVLRKCGNYPWLIEPDDESGSFLFLKTKGYELPSQRKKHEHYQCSTPSRIIIYSGFDPRHPKVICPINVRDQLGHPLVEIFSNGWNGSAHEAKAMDSLSRSFIVEFTSPEHSSSTYTVSWLAVSKRPSHLSSSLIVPCMYRCPELNACISSTLWCDNVQHCPSGFDENDINCLQFTMPALYIGLGGGLLILLTVLILCTSWCKYRQHRKTARQAEKQTVRGNLHGNNISHNGDIYCQRYSVNSSDLYLDRKDSLC